LFVQSVNCHLCNQPVDIAEARTDDRGKPVHSDCYGRAIKHSKTPVAENALQSVSEVDLNPD